MIVKQPAVAGTLESSDIQISIFPNPGMGLDIQLQSNAKAQFGDSIRSAVRDVLDREGVKNAGIRIIDRGALECVIRARVEAAVLRGKGEV